MNQQLRRRSIGSSAARSSLLTILGEYVLPGRGSAWQESLVASLAALGYKPQSARQALTRSIAAGWLTAERHGRRSQVRLSGETADMLRSGAERIYGFGQPWDWDGQWLLVMARVPEERRAVRHQVRSRLAWAGFGALGSGIWISPHVERESELVGIVGNGFQPGVQSFRATFGSLGRAEDVAASAWDLEVVAAKYREFVAGFESLRPRTPEAAFQAQTLLVHEWRKFPFVDPDLPESVLPKVWPRSRAHELFMRRHDAWHSPAQAYFAELEDGAQPR